MIYIGSDHAGFQMKEKLKNYLTKNSYCFEDVGTHSIESCDYPIIAKSLCEKITNDDIGILICGTGIGMSIAANRFKNIRAGLCTTKKQAEMTRRHNNANVLVLQGRDMCYLKNISILKTFLLTSFEGGRHEKRVNMLSEI